MKKKGSLVISRILIACLLAILMSCDSNDRLIYNQPELHARADALPLGLRYDLYLQVYRSQTPRNPLLAENVAALGEPARRYVIRKSKLSSVMEFQAILAILSKYDRQCSQAEYVSLLNSDAMTRSRVDTRAALKRYVDVVCRKNW